MTPTDPALPEDDPADVEPADRVGQLRGAGVSVDGRRVGQVAIGSVLVTLLVLTVVFTLVGIHTNQQDDRLHNDGVPVTFTVSGCLGLLGGSGSNAAGYSCHGTYTLDGRTYSSSSRATRSTDPGPRWPPSLSPAIPPWSHRLRLWPPNIRRPACSCCRSFCSWCCWCSLRCWWCCGGGVRATSRPTVLPSPTPERRAGGGQEGGV